MNSFMQFFLPLCTAVLNYMIMYCFLNSQSSLTGESGTTEKTSDIREDNSTPLLDLKNICFMVCIITTVLSFTSVLFVYVERSIFSTSLMLLEFSY